MFARRVGDCQLAILLANSRLSTTTAIIIPTISIVTPYISPSPAASSVASRTVRLATATGGLLLRSMVRIATTCTSVPRISTPPIAVIATTDSPLGVWLSSALRTLALTQSGGLRQSLQSENGCELWFRGGHWKRLCYNRGMKTKMKRNLIYVVVAGLLVSPCFLSGGPKVSGISQACKSSPECVAAAEKEAEAIKNAEESANNASAYQQKVKNTAVEIASKEAQIAANRVEVNDLNSQIKETEVKISETQDALAELLVSMHFEQDAEPIKVLAGSTSISDLAEKVAREEVAKQEINAHAGTIKELKKNLEDNKAQVVAKLKQAETAKTELERAKKEQAELVAKYENDAEGYEAEAEKARKAKIKAEQEWLAAHQTYFTGSSYTGVNTYPWQGECPGRQDAYITYRDGKKIGGYVCECVSYAGWKAYEYTSGRVAPAWGNAYSWDDVARSLGYTVDHNPSSGSVGQIDGGAYGHVFWVESVNGDGSINITEYNAWPRYGDFNARTIPAAQVANYNYIHF